MQVFYCGGGWSALECGICHSYISGYTPMVYKLFLLIWGFGIELALYSLVFVGYSCALQGV